MRATNFSVKSGIYFVVGGAQLDMHNDYDSAAFSVGAAIVVAAGTATPHLGPRTAEPRR